MKYLDQYSVYGQIMKDEMECTILQPEIRQLAGKGNVSVLSLAVCS